REGLAFRGGKEGGARHEGVTVAGHVDAQVFEGRDSVDEFGGATSGEGAGRGVLPQGDGDRAVRRGRVAGLVQHADLHRRRDRRVGGRIARLRQEGEAGRGARTHAETLALRLLEDSRERAEGVPGAGLV